MLIVGCCDCTPQNDRSTSKMRSRHGPVAPMFGGVWACNLMCHSCLPFYEVNTFEYTSFTCAGKMHPKHGMGPVHSLSTDWRTDCFSSAALACWNVFPQVDNAIVLLSCVVVAVMCNCQAVELARPFTLQLICTYICAAIVQILFEDEWLLAVNKPPGIITAPKHRFQVLTPSEQARQRPAWLTFIPRLHPASVHAPLLLW